MAHRLSTALNANSANGYLTTDALTVAKLFGAVPPVTKLLRLKGRVPTDD